MLRVICNSLDLNIVIYCSYLHIVKPIFKTLVCYYYKTYGLNTSNDSLEENMDNVPKTPDIVQKDMHTCLFLFKDILQFLKMPNSRKGTRIK